MNRDPSSPSRSTRHRGYLARLFADRRFDPLQNAAARRRASVVQLAATAVLLTGLGAAMAWPSAPLWLVVLTAVVLFVPFVIATGRMNASIGGMTELRTHDLDEAQRQLRDRGYRRAYLIAGVGTLGFVLASFGYVAGWLPVAVLVALAAVVLFAWLGAPAHVIAWTMPDPGED